MLTELKAYSSLQSAPQLLLDDNGQAETDLIQIRNIEGIDPVVASIGTAPFGSVDGEAFTGTSVGIRNIVLTIHPNPDWRAWTYEALRRLLYSYFMPKQASRLVFYSNDMPTVYIEGYVESVVANPFSQDPEFLVSIICPDPYFTAITPIILSGGNGEVIDIENNGSIEAGFQLRVDWDSGAVPTSIKVQNFEVVTGVSSTKYFQLSSLPQKKYAESTDISIPETVSVLSYVKVGSEWPMLLPGDNQFQVITDAGQQTWELQYSARFGGL